MTDQDLRLVVTLAASLPRDGTSEDLQKLLIFQHHPTKLHNSYGSSLNRLLFVPCNLEISICGVDVCILQQIQPRSRPNVSNPTTYAQPWETHSNGFRHFLMSTRSCSKVDLTTEKPFCSLLLTKYCRFTEQHQFKAEARITAARE